MTAEELLRLPVDAVHHELVAGELHMAALLDATRGAMTARIAARLGAYVEEHRLGQVYSANTGFLLARDPDTVCAPSISFVRRERIVETNGYFPGAPDVVIEIISASDLYSDVMEMLARYQRAGTPVVVLLIAALRKGTIFRGAHGIDFTHTFAIEDQIPGWSMTLDDIFTTAR